MTITNIVLSENTMAIEVEARAAMSISGNLSIIYKNMPSASLNFFDPSFFGNSMPVMEGVSMAMSIKEEWYSDYESTISFTLDLTEVAIATYEEQDEPFDSEQRFQTLYINEEAELIIALHAGAVYADLL
jgi:hypothetical protein